MSRGAVIESVEKEHLRSDVPNFNIGDTIRVSIKIIEGNKERIQAFTGTVIAKKGKGLSETVTLYRVAYGSAMERVFMLHSPRIVSIETMRPGKVRRSKLYYLRGKMGKRAKVQEKILGKEKKVFIQEENIETSSYDNEETTPSSEE